MNRIPVDPRLPQGLGLSSPIPSPAQVPQKVADIERYIGSLNARLFSLFKSIAAQINAGADGFLGAVVTVTTDYTVLQNDQIILVDTTAGNATITLPAATDTLNKVFTVKKKTSDGNTVTVDPASGNVDGSATKAWTTALASFRFASDGANYWIV